MTRYINTVHKVLNSSAQIAEILAGYLVTTKERHLVDLCSGSGGPMPEVLTLLASDYGIANLRLTLTDLYPNLEVASSINDGDDPSRKYLTHSVDARSLSAEIPGIRTMICSFHHMPPDSALKILSTAVEWKQPLFIYEISDNSFPKWLWWIAFPINIITVLILTPMVRPFSLQQLVFTYFIPVLPLLIAWDGAVSNARTYTLDDLDQIISSLPPNDYQWERNSLKGRGGNKLYLLGHPAES